MMSNYEVGKKRITEILGDDALERMKQKVESVAPDFSKYVIEFVYGELYNRPNFSDKSRELAAVACLIGQGNLGLPLRSHFAGMLNVGWTKDELIELVTFLSTYAGFPKIVDVLAVLNEVLKERVL